ncbi:ribosomal RNA processing 4 [Wolffia australiana]
MRDLQLRQLRLNQTQRVRLNTALHKLQELCPAHSGAAVAVADKIPANPEDGVLKGHGTLEMDGQIVATLCGVIERVNKLVYVRTHRSRYKPEVGDIIVGRVIEVATKLWRLEINFSQDAVLMLSSMNLPDGIQRRRTATDELNMRSIFEENDVICAEVRGFQHDGSLHLQARSLKYGKLMNGQLLRVPPYLVKRRKQHFHYLEEYGLDLILGCNGLVWVGGHISIPEGEGQPRGKSDISLDTRQHICRIANGVRVISSLGFSLTVEAVVEAAKACVSSKMDIKDMLGPEFHVQMAEREVERRILLSKKKG